MAKRQPRTVDNSGIHRLQYTPTIQVGDGPIRPLSGYPDLVHFAAPAGFRIVQVEIERIPVAKPRKRGR